ncbi:MAG: SIMPL domain-containing protein [Anaerolineae bacterium]|nr:SIMPL domain-containing protein [Anaerolineae bacterium]
MFNRIKVLFSVVVVAMLLVACTNVQAKSQLTPEPVIQTPQRTITVVGLGKISLVPDIARISIGAQARASTVAVARNEVEQKMAAVAAALTELGIAEKDLQSSYYSIYYEQEPYQPSVSEEGSVEEPKGVYNVSSMLEVTVRDVEKAGEVLDGAVAAGANQVYGVTFTVSDNSKWESQAREKAMADAKLRAGELTGLAGVALGEVLSVSEVIGGSAVAYAERGMGGGGGGIAPGELEMSTQVQVTFALQ